MKSISTKAAAASRKSVKGAKVSRKAAAKATPEAPRAKRVSSRNEGILAYLGKHSKGADVHVLAKALGIKDSPNSLPYKALRELVAAGSIEKNEEGVYTLA